MWWRPDLARLDARFRLAVERAARRVAPPTLQLPQPIAHATTVLDELERDRSVSPPRLVPQLPRSPELDRLAHVFGLGRLETDVVALAIAVEVDPRYRQLTAILDPEPSAVGPSVSLAVELLWDGALDEGWHACFAAGSPLVRHGLVQIDDSGPLPARSVRLARELDPTSWFSARPPIVETHARADLAGAISACAAWARDRNAPLVLVQGLPGTGRDAVARAIATRAERRFIALDGRAPLAARRAALRDAMWTDAWLLVHELDDGAWIEIAAVLRGATIGAIVVVPPRVDLGQPAGREQYVLQVPDLDATIRTGLWADILAGDAAAAQVDTAALGARAAASPAQMVSAWSLATAARLGAAALTTTIEVERAFAALPPVRVAGVARRLSCPHAADDLVLPPETAREIELIRAWLRSGNAMRRVLGDRRVPAGLTCLFNGPPGTGKTLATQVIAREAGIDLYHVDLAQVVSKYIGETEKNLAGLFDMLESRRALLFFDEADALFGRRTAAKDAHDRYANIETSYLLQRIDQYGGAVILATNMLENIDAAFLRRMQVIAEFPLPGPNERVQIWSKLLPAERSDEIDLDTLGRTFALSGADIRNATITATLVAADRAQPLALTHIVPAVCRELRKSGRLIDLNDLGTLGRYVS